MASESAGVKIFNTSNPVSPIELGSYYDGGLVMDLAVSGDYIFAANYFKGLEILDVSNLSNPIKIGTYYDGGHAKGVDVAGNLIFVADAQDGLEILQMEIKEEMFSTSETASSTDSNTNTISQTTTTSSFDIFFAFLSVLTFFLMTKRRKRT